MQFLGPDMYYVCVRIPACMNEPMFAATCDEVNFDRMQPASVSISTARTAIIQGQKRKQGGAAYVQTVREDGS